MKSLRPTTHLQLKTKTKNKQNRVIRFQQTSSIKITHLSEKLNVRCGVSYIVWAIDSGEDFGVPLFKKG